MRQDYTDITIVLDRSGSMESVRTPTILAFNEYVESQKIGPGTAHLTLVQFDDQYEPVYTALEIGSAPPLSVETYVPRGATALLDAVGRTIASTGVRLAGMPEDQRPGTVLFVIQTDGLENASHEYTTAKVTEMVAHQRDKYRWEFVFLGADIDAIASAAAMGISAGKAARYSKDCAGTANVFRAMAAGTAALRQRRASGEKDAEYKWEG